MRFDVEEMVLSGPFFLAVLVAVAVVSSVGQAAGAIYRAGIVGDEGSSSISGQRLNAKIEAILREAGYQTAEISPHDLCDGHTLMSGGFDLLVVPESARLPARSVAPVVQYLERGGDILALGAPMWSEATIEAGGKWVGQEEFLTRTAAEKPEHPIRQLAFGEAGLKGWQRAAFNTSIPVSYTTSQGPAPDQSALHVRMDAMDGWETYRSPALDHPFPAGHTLTVFAAKGGSQTTQLSVEWTEKDGSRWIAVVALSSHWKRYVLKPADFKYWHSTPGRGGPGDGFRPENAEAIVFGLALSHTGAAEGPQEYWIANVGCALAEGVYGEVVASLEPAHLEILSPAYKFYTISREMLETERNPLIDASNQVLAPHPRPQTGFRKGRDWRWMPFLKVAGGAPGVMLAHAEGPYKGGIWASIGVQDGAWYEKPESLQLIRGVVRRIRSGVFLIEGGTEFYTYKPGQTPLAGARIANLGKEPVEAHVALTTRAVSGAGNGKESLTRTLRLAPGGSAEVTTTLPKLRADSAERRIDAVLYDSGGREIDRISQGYYCYQPRREKHFITVRNGDFQFDGRRWRANGVNYMPSSGIAVNVGDPWWGRYFEGWLGERSYDSAIVEEDLKRIKDIGMNAISIFIYRDSVEAENLRDILRLARKYGLKVNLSLRPGTPMDFLWPQMKQIIQHYELAEEDTVFAYDLAWEPMFNTHEDRAVWDSEWRAWLDSRYGSVENAERDWGYEAPRDAKDDVTNPLPYQIDTDGGWRVMVAAYRRFLDTLLYRKYGAARELVQSVDPNHLMSFRMAEAGNPTYRWDGRIPYDWPYLAAAVDILEPEAYGRIGDWNKVKAGIFEFEYARYCGPDLPMVWAEAGVSAWDSSRTQASEAKLDFQGRYFSDFYQMLTESGADGVFFWWYPGGFRTGENSDYGIINADGSDRPATRAIRAGGPRFLSGNDAPEPDALLEVDRDRHPDGVAGVYDSVKDEFWKLWSAGKRPGLKDGGTGTTSADCPLTAVGNTAYGPDKPLKYLDAAIDVVEVRASGGSWQAVPQGGDVSRSESMELRVRVRNLAEARWLKDDAELSVNADRIALREDVLRHASAVVTGPLKTQAQLVTLRMRTSKGVEFGEAFSFTLR